MFVFDNVDHGVLLHELWEWGVGGEECVIKLILVFC